MLHVFCDFDGTITEPDTLRLLTERLGAGPEHYRETGRLLCAGALSLREAVARDVGTIRAPFAQAAALLRAHVAVDTGFVPFAPWCAARAPRAAARSWSATAFRTGSRPPSPTSSSRGAGEAWWTGAGRTAFPAPSSPPSATSSAAWPSGSAPRAERGAGSRWSSSAS